MEGTVKISEKQLLMLVDVLQETIPLVFPRGECPFKLDRDQRWALWASITNQQSNEPVDVKCEEPKEVGR